ncbi:DUF6765 family protein [Photobacterium sp. DNB22_13_2]
MDIEFHYWITGLIAKRAGFKDGEAKIIAYASQYVDDNDVCLVIKDESDGSEYENFISQTMNILKPKHDLMRIYPIFHFVPGNPEADSACRKDGKMHILNTTPDNDNVNKMLDAAFNAPERTRFYRIGIATHAFVDTWAHQNFVGWYDYFNNIGIDLKPDIGHADGEHHPDWVSHIWDDNRLVNPVVNNRVRFTAAAKALFMKYCGYLADDRGVDNSDEWSELESELIVIQGNTYSGSKVRHRDERIEKYKETLQGWDDFNERLWFDEAIYTKVRGFKDSHDGIFSKVNLFDDAYLWRVDVEKRATNWYKFQSAVKAHEALGIELLSPIFKRMGYDLEPRKRV